jgi:hypothetical protein
VVVMAGGALDGSEPVRLHRHVVGLTGLATLLREIGVSSAAGGSTAAAMRRAWNIVQAEERAPDQSTRLARHISWVRSLHGGQTAVPARDAITRAKGTRARLAWLFLALMSGAAGAATWRAENPNPIMSPPYSASGQLPAVQYDTSIPMPMQPPSQPAVRHHGRNVAHP